MRNRKPPSGPAAVLRKSVLGTWFTLAELIVVITVLAVLATVGFLALSGYSRDAKDAAVKANVRSVYAAISSESAVTDNSPRYYVVHDAAAALTGSAVAYVDGSPVTLTGGDWNQAGTNYSAGNPDWAKLKLNPDKFRLSSFGSRPAAAFGTAEAAYDPKSVAVGALDAALAPTASGRNRSASFFQAAGTSLATGLVSVAGDFPAPTEAQISAGAARGLVKDPDGSGALVDGESSGTSGSPFSSSSSSGGWAGQYPGCDSPDITLANGQVWAACNVGATKAWALGAAFSNTGATNQPADYNSVIRDALGSYFQWGRNDDVTASASTATLAAAGTTAWGVGHSSFVTNGTSPYDWIATQDGNLWGGGSTTLANGTFAFQSAGDRAAMKGPCAAWYHVPTQAEWWSAMSTINGTLANTAVWQDDTALASTLKLPLAGTRNYSSAAYNYQGLLVGYWTSSPAGTNGYNVTLSATQVLPAGSTSRALGLSVRCIKDPAPAPTYPGCDTPDVTLANGQTWAMCNVGATKAWTGTLAITNCSGWATDCVSALRPTLGSYFQQGRNDDVTVTATTATKAAAGTTAGGVGHSSFITNGTNPYDWIATQDGNLWGWGATSLGAGTFAGQAAGNQTAMKGPCASGYHVPTQAEWYAAASALNPAVTNTAAWQNDMTLRTTLKLPLAGSRHYSAAAYHNQGTNGYYWASSPKGTYGYFVALSATQVVPAENFGRAYGFSVRCIKD